MKVLSIIILLYLLLSSCVNIAEFEIRSGTIHDDDIEEPLSRKAKRYENNLNIANSIIDLIINKDIEEIYNNYFSSDFKKMATLDDTKKIIATIYDKYGEIKSYKPFQWYFKLSKQQNQNLLYCIKIIHHQNAVLYYYFVFANEKYSNLMGFHIIEKT